MVSIQQAAWQCLAAPFRPPDLLPTAARRPCEENMHRTSSGLRVCPRKISRRSRLGHFLHYAAQTRQDVSMRRISPFGGRHHIRNQANPQYSSFRPGLASCQSRACESRALYSADSVRALSNRQTLHITDCASNFRPSAHICQGGGPHRGQAHHILPPIHN